MKLKMIRIGEKFVFSEEGGVWKKIEKNKAKCVFGKPGVSGTECEVDPFCDVFCIEDREKKIRRSGLRAASVVFHDEDEKVIVKLQDVPWDKASAFMSAECFKMRMPRKRKSSYFCVSDVGIDVDRELVFIEVRETLGGGESERLSK